MAKKLIILGIPGSLRKDSYNVAVLKSAGELLPQGVELKISEHFYDLPLSYFEIPLSEAPESVKGFREEIKSADAILFSTPQYNYNFPTVIKNALDWGSRPDNQNVYSGKPAATIGACIDTLGTAQALTHLRQSMEKLDMKPIPDHEVMIDSVKEKFDSNLTLKDDDVIKQISKLLSVLISQIKE